MIWGYFLDFGVSTLALHPAPLNITLEYLEGLGINYCEIINEYPLDRIQEDLISSYSLKFIVHAPISDVNIASPNKRIRRSSIMEIKSSLDLAAHLDSDKLILHPGSVPFLARAYKDKIIGYNLQSLKELKKYADDLGVTLCLENMPRMEGYLYNNLKELQELVEELEIMATLDHQGKLRGCGFMKNNGQHLYCGSIQRVHNLVNLFIDERDMSAARKAKGLVMLEGVMCEGGKGIGRCDRSCLMFWREEWLEKIDQPLSYNENPDIELEPIDKRVSSLASSRNPSNSLKAGDLVRVRSEKEILATLEHNGKLKGCSFIHNMTPYCDSHQRILKPLERYYSEIDEQVKKCRGLFILDGVTCDGETSFGHCDRSCLIFWREEWLEKVR